MIKKIVTRNNNTYILYYYDTDRLSIIIKNDKVIGNFDPEDELRFNLYEERISFTEFENTPTKTLEDLQTPYYSYIQLQSSLNIPIKVNFFEKIITYLE